MTANAWSKRAQLKRKIARQARRVAGSTRARLGGAPAHLLPEEDLAYTTTALEAGWPDDVEPHPLSVGDQEFVLYAAGRIADLDLPPDELVVYKMQPMIDRYRELGAAGEFRRVAELGILQGGSTAFLFQVFQPDVLVGFDIVPDVPPALDAFIERRGLQQRVQIHCGVDQSDTATLLAHVHAALDGASLDLVVDDASHLYAPTQASFNALFPLLREGGLYIIEDWQWAHIPGERWQQRGGYDPGKPATTNLIVEIMMLLGTRPDIVREVRVNRYTVEVVRGSTEVGSPMDMATLTMNRGNPYRPVI